LVDLVAPTRPLYRKFLLPPYPAPLPRAPFLSPSSYTLFFRLSPDGPSWWEIFHKSSLAPPAEWIYSRENPLGYSLQSEAFPAQLAFPLSLPPPPPRVPDGSGNPFPLFPLPVKRSRSSSSLKEGHVDLRPPSSIRRFLFPNT